MSLNMHVNAVKLSARSLKSATARKDGKMGFIDLEENGRYRKEITTKLARRGLTPDLSEEWEIHGPHLNMNYSVLIGWAHDSKDEWFCVAIYPWAVYEIEDADDWWKCRPENRLYVECITQNKNSCRKCSI